jgi:hypothetical protein
MQTMRNIQQNFQQKIRVLLFFRSVCSVHRNRLHFNIIVILGQEYIPKQFPPILTYLIYFAYNTLG